MSLAPRNAREEPTTTLRIPEDGHGGSFYRIGWVDELPKLEFRRLPETTYRGPRLDWETLSEDLRKALCGLQSEQEEFANAWKDAIKEDWSENYFGGEEEI